MLLTRFALPRRDGDYLFRATPGGEIEASEYALDTAQRELREKLGLVLQLSSPVHRASGPFECKHKVVDNVDAFYFARFPCGSITLDGVDDAERSVLKEVRWWSPDEIDASADPIYPPDLADASRRPGCR